MDRPVHLRLIVLAWMMAAPAACAAEDGPKPQRERLVSPRVAEMLAATMPKFEPAAEAPRVTESPPPIAGPDKPANGLVRLPSYIVREPKLPPPDEVMTKREREKIAMQKYLGDENGLERALNMFSVSGLWAKIPVLGKFPFIVGQFQGRHSGLAVGPQTNEQRALEMYEKEKIAERWDQLSGLESPSLKPPAAPPPLKE
jgi:hypothetical protein